MKRKADPKLSLRGSINAKCKQCIYDPHSGLGAWRQQVDGCTVTLCPLWNVRPRSSAGPSRPRRAAISVDPSSRIGVEGDRP